MHLIGLGLVAATTAVFSHRDRTPEDPELVSLVATADREAVVAGHATTTVVRLEVAAATRTDDSELGVNLGLLLDTSGSMAGEPIEQARAAVHALVNELRPQDRLTVVTFDSRAQLVQASATIDDVDLRSLHARIDEIRAEGTTDLAAGLGTLLAQLNASPTVGDLDRIVIVGDGVPNDARPIAGRSRLRGRPAVRSRPSAWASTTTRCCSARWRGTPAVDFTTWSAARIWPAASPPNCSAPSARSPPTCHCSCRPGPA
ncbi:MAG: VWA domain-containing protein [Deltaproteobacteria bacterium]|nr:VWA domain-containing protein [Deltaproteobacteria bacterium]